MSADQPLVWILDDDVEICRALGRLLRAAGRAVATFASAAEFLALEMADRPGCLVADLYLPQLTGLDLLSILRASGRETPVIFITGEGDVPMSVRAMKAGAVDFLTKPVDDVDLLAAVDRALDSDARIREERAELDVLARRFESLTPREREVFAWVVRGFLNKQIAGRLGTTQQTVKVHRGRAMQKMGADSLAQLVHFAERLGIRGLDETYRPAVGSMSYQTVG